MNPYVPYTLRIVDEAKSNQPYKTKIDYPPRQFSNSPRENIPTGYQPKRKNPGGLNFFVYDYVYQTNDQIPLNFPGEGWRHYQHTGTLQ